MTWVKTKKDPDGGGFRFGLSRGFPFKGSQEVVVAVRPEDLTIY